jgi:protein TonB
MNPKFILPASLALTAHVFLLFGLPGKAPGSVSIAPAVPAPSPPDELKLLLDSVEVAHIREDTDNTGSESKREMGAVRRLVEFPVTDPRPEAMPIPILVPVDGDSGPLTSIPPDWGEPRGPTGPRVVPAIELDREPRARTQPAPSYPYDLRSQGVEGTVNVEFAVDEAGNTYDATIVGATASGFADAALRAVARWKFEPGLKNGRHVRFRLSVPIMFRIDRL